MSLDEDKRDRILREALSCRIQLVAYARAIIGNYSSAEDAVQEGNFQFKGRSLKIDYANPKRK